MRLMALIEAFDKVAANQDAMQAAAVEFDSLLQVRHPLAWEHHVHLCWANLRAVICTCVT